MAKRKCEQPLIAVLPPCKRPLCELPPYPRHCPPHAMQVSAKRKRKPEPEAIPSPDCGRPPPRDGTPDPSHPSSKKPRPAENQCTTAAAYQCQKDEAFREYNSFHFWRSPLPDVDFSELVAGTCDGDKQPSSAGTEALEEMDG
ncbi:unnamed protein product [Ranitomeya imitator]|uniref:Putative WW-binding domain-containing protein n=1 Tax=Ranitomeya imitator TaxID=111125 RepID=A0ABN9M0Y5_9NEOB|nr:unnamed protein product [Ranitomeya imitator]